MPKPTDHLDQDEGSDTAELEHQGHPLIKVRKLPAVAGQQMGHLAVWADQETPSPVFWIPED